MADICKCTGHKCPVRESCYRYMVEPNKYWQTYSCLEDICIPNEYAEFILHEDNKLIKNKGCENVESNQKRSFKS